jgi:hypothetical protein
VTTGSTTHTFGHTSTDRVHAQFSTSTTHRPCFGTKQSRAGPTATRLHGASRSGTRAHDSPRGIDLGARQETIARTYGPEGRVPAVEANNCTRGSPTPSQAVTNAAVVSILVSVALVLPLFAEGPGPATALIADTENPSEQYRRRLGKRVGFTPSRVRIPDRPLTWPGRARDRRAAASVVAAGAASIC